jgi:hypothetical protein
VILASVLFWGTVFFAWKWHCFQQKKRVEDPRWTLQRIAARSKTADRLPFPVLAEMAHVTADEPKSLFSVHPKELQRNLCKHPSIAYSRVWRLLPGTIGIEYALRQPVAILGGVKNVGIDAQGKLFFLSPFFASKRLPKIFLKNIYSQNLAALEREIRKEEIQEALMLLSSIPRFLGSYGFTVSAVDCSKKHHENFFAREIIVTLSSADTKHDLVFLRLPSNIQCAMKRLPKVLQKSVRPQIIDMRYENFVILSEKAL